MTLKNKFFTILLLMIVFSLYGCTSGGNEETVFITSTQPSSSEAGSSSEQNDEITDETAVSEGTDSSTPTEDTSVAQNNQETDSEFEMDLSDYIGLSVDLENISVSYSEIQDEITNSLYDYIEYSEVSRKSQSGDVVNINMTGSSSHDILYDFSSNDYDLFIGSEDFGAEFDRNLTGVEAGDTLSFTVKYDEDDEDAEYPGKTIKYEVVVNSVYQIVTPELTDDFVSEVFGIDSAESLTDTIADRLYDKKLSEQKEYTSEILLKSVIENSSLKSYNDQFYDSCASRVKENYKKYFDTYNVSSLDEVYSILGLSKDDIEQEITDMLYRTAVINSIAEAEGIDGSDVESDVLNFLYSNAYINYYDKNSDDEVNDGLQ